METNNSLRYTTTPKKKQKLESGEKNVMSAVENYGNTDIIWKCREPPIATFDMIIHLREGIFLGMDHSHERGRSPPRAGFPSFLPLTHVHTV